MGWGLERGCWGKSDSNQPAFALILKLSMTDPETASMKTKNKQKNPLDACLKCSFLGPVSNLLNHLVSRGMAWDSAFFMGTHSDSDSKD